MQGIQQQFQTPVLRSQERSQNSELKSQQIRNRMGQDIEAKREAINELVVQLRALAQDGQGFMYKGNAIKDTVANIATRNGVEPDELIKIFSKNIDINKDYSSERLSQKADQIEAAMGKSLETRPAILDSELVGLINKSKVNASHVGIVVGSETKGDENVATAAELASRVSDLANALSSKQTSSPAAQDYFAAFVGQHADSKNIDKLQKAFETVRAQLNNEQVHTQELEKAVDIIKTFNTAAE